VLFPNADIQVNKDTGFYSDIQAMMLKKDPPQPMTSFMKGVTDFLQ
jgi:hypothetical protein